MNEPFQRNGQDDDLPFLARIDVLPDWVLFGLPGAKAG
jgi:hypothetical protein